MEKTLAVDTRR